MTDPLRIPFFLSDLFSEIASPDFVKFVVGALVLGSVYLLATKISDKVTAGLVRKEELKKSLEEFKVELTKELVTSSDLKIFKLEQAVEFERAMKENRHAVNNAVATAVNAINVSSAEMGARVNKIEVVLARIDEHFKASEPTTRKAS